MENKNFHWLILLVILFAVIAAWLSFPVFFEWLITKHFHIDPEKYGQKLGAVGDTYGSLNTLISSIALCAVAYSTYLQITSLNEARKDNKMQLELAEKSHAEQVKESRNAIFANKFYSLLNFKEDKLKGIVLRKKIYNLEGEEEFKEVSALFAIHDLAATFHNILKYNPSKILECERNQIQASFYDIAMKDLKYETISLLISYFYIYTDLFNLLKNSNLDSEEINFYKSVLSNTISSYEQIVIFWIAPIITGLDLDNSKLFSFYPDIDVFTPYAKKFHKFSHFKYESWEIIFED